MKDAKRNLRRSLAASPATGDRDALCGLILAHPWFRSARTVMAYYAAMPGEADLGPLLEETLRQSKILALPRCGAGGRMSAKRVLALSELVPGLYGIPEPPEDAPEAADIDLVLAPGAAFDRTGGRLGRGGGYYDRFLADYSGRTMGVCYGARLLERVPMEAHDHRVDAVATDTAIILCGTESDAE